MAGRVGIDTVREFMSKVFGPGLFVWKCLDEVIDFRPQFWSGVIGQSPSPSTFHDVNEWSP